MKQVTARQVSSVGSHYTLGAGYLSIFTPIISRKTEG